MFNSKNSQYTNMYVHKQFFSNLTILHMLSKNDIRISQKTFTVLSSTMYEIKLYKKRFCLYITLYLSRCQRYKFASFSSPSKPQKIYFDQDVHFIIRAIDVSRTIVTIFSFVSSSLNCFLIWINKGTIHR